MKSNVVFLRCKHCGSIVGLIKAGAPTTCCGEEMERLVPNTTDGATEKHVPVAQRRDGKIVVQVGSAEHPMIPEHYIEWIAVVNENSTERISLMPGNKPYAEFCDKGGKIEVYEYCNLHGLWMSEL
ncbi:MAG TPA: desulfoferrodoxin family protein [Oscillospiraceae bacterium]|nr:desulfoferrodoxin family protein [Oscillospiraceae bacterium]